MVIAFSRDFEKSFKKIKNNEIKTRIKKQIRKIIENPKVGKPMKNGRKGTRELYIPPFRLSYSYNNNEIIILDFYHKDIQ